MSIRPVRVTTLMSVCAAAVGLLVVFVSRTDRGTPTVASEAAASREARLGRQWFVGDGYFVSSMEPAAQSAEGVPADWASSLHIVNPGTEPAHVGILIYRTRGTPARSAVEVRAGRLYTIDLARRRDIPRGEPFWVAIDADRPVFPQMVHQTTRPWDLVPEGLTMVTPQPASLDSTDTDWIYPDAFQGGTARWLEQETVTLLNPSAQAAARFTFEFRDGRPQRSHEVTLAPQRVTLVDLASLYPDDGTPLVPALSGDFTISVTSTRPVVTQQTRRAYWRGRREITSLTTRPPLGRQEIMEAREWYYAGGWTRDLGILPRDGQADRTWHLLFTYPLDGLARRVSVQPSGATPGRELAMVPGRSDLQWLHLDEWYEALGVGTPWALSVRADGPVAPAIATAEYEPWSQAMPGAMGAGNLVSDVAARQRETWLGVAYHGGRDDRPADWTAAWQLYNPGPAALHVTLYFHLDDGVRLAHPAVVAPGRVTRVSGDAVPGLPVGRAFVVQAVGDQPFAAHAWVRVTARGVPTIRALSTSTGVSIPLAPDAAGTDQTVAAGVQ